MCGGCCNRFDGAELKFILILGPGRCYEDDCYIMVVIFVRLDVVATMLRPVVPCVWMFVRILWRCMFRCKLKDVGVAIVGHAMKIEDSYAHHGSGSMNLV